MEQTILRSLLYNENFIRKVFPYLRAEYFLDYCERIVFELIQTHITAYHNCPTRESLLLDLNKRQDLTEDAYKNSVEILENLSDDPADIKWLVAETETFCKDKSLYLALQKCVEIVEDQDNTSNNISVGHIPDILKAALSVSFDTSIGHVYLNDSDIRYNDIHNNVKKIPFDIDYLNLITNGGIEPKTLNIILAGTNVGKTLVMCHDAASKMMMGYNVLYVTYEMAEQKIGQRIDANLTSTPLNSFVDMTRTVYDKKMEIVHRNCKGKLIIKEYPAAATTVANLRHLISELKLKKSFQPDVIYVDYINLLGSSRMKYGNNIGSYGVLKSVAEEMRGLAQELNVSIITATQTNRAGQSSSDLNLDDTSESFGLPQTSDLMIGIMAPDDLKELNQLLFKQLKNRYSSIVQYSKGIVGVDYERMKLYNIESEGQVDTGKPMVKNLLNSENKKDHNKFDGFK